MRVSSIGSATIVGCVLLTGTVGLPAAAAAAAPAQCQWFTLDVDGGGEDVAVGLPSYDLPGKPDAGAIVVWSNVKGDRAGSPGPATASRLYTADDFPGLSAQAGARFGAAVVVSYPHEFVAGTCQNLFVAAPGQTVDGEVGAGQVYELRGAAGGLDAVLGTYDEASLPGTGGPEAGAGFGSSLSVDNVHTMFVGVPGRDVRGAADAGRVDRLDFATRTSTEPVVTVIEQPGARSETGDRFGEVLHVMHWTSESQEDLFPDRTTVLVGIPHEDVGSKKDAGAIALVAPTSDAMSFLTADSPHAGGTAEAGDGFGSALSDLGWQRGATIEWVFAVGVPGEDLGPLKDAGSVSFAKVDITGLPDEPMPQLKGLASVVTQDTSLVPGAAEAGDAYGSAVLTGFFGKGPGGVTQLVAGAPGEDVGARTGAGQLSRTFIEVDGSTYADVHGPAAWSQDTPGVSGGAEIGDFFGERLSSISLEPGNDEVTVAGCYLITVPGEDVGTVPDAGRAYLGAAPHLGPVELALPVAQAGAGLGMVPMELALSGYDPWYPRD